MFMKVTLIVAGPNIPMAVLGAARYWPYWVCIPNTKVVTNFAFIVYTIVQDNVIN